MIFEVPNAELDVDVHGDAGGSDPLLLLHAGVTDKRSWHPLVDQLAGARQCLAYDARGYGRTTYRPSHYSDVADALAVLDGMDADSAVVVGASSGGRTAVNLALARPDRVSALVLIAPAISGVPEPKSYSDPVQRLDEAIDAADAAGDLETVNRLEAWLWLDGPAAPEGRVPDPVRALFLEMNLTALQAPDPGDSSDPGDAWAHLEEIAIPTLVLAGDLDVPHFQDRARTAAERIPSAEFITLSGVAHLPHFESDVACRKSIVEFITR